MVILMYMAQYMSKKRVIMVIIIIMNEKTEANKLHTITNKSSVESTDKKLHSPSDFVKLFTKLFSLQENKHLCKVRFCK